MKDPDPLCLPGIDSLEWEIAELASDSGELCEWDFSFAPDDLHKANIRGGTHDIRFPDGCASSWTLRARHVMSTAGWGTNGSPPDRSRHSHDQCTGSLPLQWRAELAVR
jgi:hypothetical protein